MRPALYILGALLGLIQLCEAAIVVDGQWSPWSVVIIVIKVIITC